MTLKKQFSFSAIGSIGTKIIQFSIFILLAKILSPTEFGLFAILNVINSFSQIFIDMGLGSALIYNQNVTKKHYGTAFYISLFIALIFFILFFIFSKEFSVYFNKDELENILKIFAFIFITNSLIVVPFSILQKEMKFKTISYIELLSLTLVSICTVILALLDFHVWSLVFFMFADSFVKMILFMKASKYSISFEFGYMEFKELIHYTKYLIGSKLLDYFVNNLDTIILAKISTSVELGLYNTAYRVMILPRTIISAIFNKVLLSNYSKLQDNHQMVREIHLKVSKFVAMLTFPFSILIFLFPDSITYILFNEKWVGIEELLKLFAIITIWQPIGVLNNSIYLSQGKTKLQFYVSLYLKNINIIAIIIGSFWGMYGILYALIIAVVLNFMPGIYFVSKTIDLKIRSVLFNLLSIVLPLLLASLCVIYCKMTLLLSHFIEIGIFILVYLLLLILFNLKELNYIKKVLDK